MNTHTPPYHYSADEPEGSSLMPSPVHDAQRAAAIVYTMFGSHVPMQPLHAMREADKIERQILDALNHFYQTGDA